MKLMPSSGSPGWCHCVLCAAKDAVGEEQPAEREGVRAEEEPHPDLPERCAAQVLVGRPLDLAVRVVSVIIVPMPVSGLVEGFFACDRCAHGLVALRRGWTISLVFSTDTSPLVNTRGFRQQELFRKFGGPKRSQPHRFRLSDFREKFVRERRFARATLIRYTRAVSTTRRQQNAAAPRGGPVRASLLLGALRGGRVLFALGAGAEDPSCRRTLPVLGAISEFELVDQSGRPYGTERAQGARLARSARSKQDRPQQTSSL